MRWHSIERRRYDQGSGKGRSGSYFSGSWVLEVGSLTPGDVWLLRLGCPVWCRQLRVPMGPVLCSGPVQRAVLAQEPAGSRIQTLVEALLVPSEAAQQPRVQRGCPGPGVLEGPQWLLRLLHGVPGLTHTAHRAGKAALHGSAAGGRFPGTPSLPLYTNGLLGSNGRVVRLGGANAPKVGSNEIEGDPIILGGAGWD